MVLEFSQGKLVVTAFEVQVRLSVSSVLLQASVEDISLRVDPPMLIANGGSVRWSIKLDDRIQLTSVQEILGIDFQS